MKFEDLPDPEPQENEPEQSKPEEDKPPTELAAESPADEPQQKQSIRRYPPPATAVRVLQPWRCTHCQAGGEIEFMSSDTCDWCWHEIVRTHGEISPECHPHKFLAVSDWKEKPRTHLADEEIANKYKDPKLHKKLMRKHGGTL